MAIGKHSFKSWFCIIVGILLAICGGIAGYAIGDAALEAAKFTTAIDILKCRIGMPSAGIIIGFFLGAFFVDAIIILKE